MKNDSALNVTPDPGKARRPANGFTSVIHITTLAVGDLSDTCHGVLRFLSGAFGLQVVKCDDALPLAEIFKRLPAIRFLLFSCSELYRRQSELEGIATFKNVWLLVETGSNTVFRVPPNGPKLVGRFSKETPGDQICSIIVETVRQMWLERDLNTDELQPGHLSVPTKSHGEESRIRALRDMFSSASVRRTIFGASSVEPYLSVILQISYASSRGIDVDVTSLASELSIPVSTLVRKLDYLYSSGSLTRIPDENDRRRTLITLTAVAQERVNRYLDYILGSI